MPQKRMPGSGLSVRPQNDVYTLLMLVAILAIAVTIGFVLNNLLSAGRYGLSITNLFGALPGLP